LLSEIVYQEWRKGQTKKCSDAGNKKSFKTDPSPSTTKKMLSNPANKAGLANFLMSDWIEVGMERLPPKKQLYLAGGFIDGKRAVLVEREVLMSDWIEVGMERLPPKKQLYLPCGFIDGKRAVLVEREVHREVEELMFDPLDVFLI
jgi:hypothetical protein